MTENPEAGTVKPQEATKVFDTNQFLSGIAKPDDKPADPSNPAVAGADAAADSAADAAAQAAENKKPEDSEEEIREDNVDQYIKNALAAPDEQVDENNDPPPADDKAKPADAAKPTEKNTENTDWKALAKELDIEATDAKDFVSQVRGKINSSGQQKVSDPTMAIDNALKMGDKELVSQLEGSRLGLQGAELEEYVNNLGETGIRAKAIEIRQQLKKDRENAGEYIRQEEAKVKSAQEAQRKIVEKEIDGLKEISGVPIDETTRAAFKETIMSGKYADALKDPKRFVRAMFLEANHNKIISQAVARVKKVEFQKGFKKAVDEYKAKLHNTDKSVNDHGGVTLHQESKNGSFNPGAFISGK